jgi:hypothetical protein
MRSYNYHYKKKKKKNLVSFELAALVQNDTK